MQPLALLLLLCGLSGSAALRGPREVTSHVGSFLTVSCLYDAGYERHQKWWCRWSAQRGCWNRIETAGTEQVVRSDRVTISDDQSQRRFTVIIERLRHSDSGMYCCGIKQSDQTSQVTVTISPARTPAPTTTTVSTTTTTTINAPTTAATTEETTDALSVTRTLSNTTGFPVPLLLSIISAVLPLLLLAAALLAWRKLKRQRTAIEIPPEPDVQEEVYYAQLSLRPRDPEPTCANADPRTGPRAGRSPEMATEYSSIRKPRAGL